MTLGQTILKVISSQKVPNGYNGRHLCSAYYKDAPVINIFLGKAEFCIICRFLAITSLIFAEEKVITYQFVSEFDAQCNEKINIVIISPPKMAKTNFWENAMRMYICLSDHILLLD